MATVIYNCKACKTGKRVLYPEVDRSSGVKRWFRRVEVVGREYPGSFVYYSKRGGRFNVGDGVCADCGRAMDWGYLQAYTVPEVKCDARCTNARGFKCDCSCGGEHHGSGWGMFTGLLAQAA